MPASACAVVSPAIPEDAVLLLVLWRKVHSMRREFGDLTEMVGRHSLRLGVEIDGGGERGSEVIVFSRKKSTSP